MSPQAEQEEEEPLVEEHEEDEPQQTEDEHYPEARQADNWNKDVNETGRWGSRSRREVLLVGGTILIVLIAVVVGVAFVVIWNKDEKEDAGDGITTGATRIVNGQRISAYELPTPPEPTYLNDPTEELIFLRAELAKEPLMQIYLENMPHSPAELEGIHENPLFNAYQRAASWLVTVDPYNVKEELVTRYSLAVIYYQMNGYDWTHADNWLAGDKNHCDWYGIACCTTGFMRVSPMCASHDFYDVVEIDLYRNNLSGSIPHAVVLLKKLVSLFMNKNNVSGEIPGEAFGVMTNFTKLYLQHNSLIGTIPDNLMSGNNLGMW